ncbi:MAG: hypothetical protein A2539_07240 [Elusimicrobia bacterium RIFOXYD2_FULL_34_15]|nr:MAG: hypothetical protein A2539_07240 [Elusimicrobia bacterium RIFOXYD2_FULL_34_15]
MRKIASICILLSACFFINGCSFDYYFNAGIKTKNAKKKIKYFSKAIDKWETDNGYKNKLNAYTNRGIEYSLLGHNEEALSDFTKALKIGEDSSTYYNRALIYNFQNKFKDSIADLNKAIKLNACFKEAYALRANLYKKIGNIKKSNEDIEKVNKISESDTPFNIGLQYYNKEMYDNAIESFSDAVNINPFHVTAYNMRGLSYIKKNNLKKALKDFSKAIEVDKNFLDAYNNRGTIYATNKEYNKALNDFKKISEIEPASPEAYYNIGILNQMKNDYENSLIYFSKAIEYSKKNPNDSTYYNRGYSYFMLGKYKEAIKDFSFAFKLNPTNSLANSYKEKAYNMIEKNTNKLNNLENIPKTGQQKSSKKGEN